MPRKHKTTSHNGAGRLRIIGGDWRTRQLPIASVEGLRPTPDRVRETLYNWLTGWVAGARCLDVFSGTGALGLEALSRGAAHTTFLEFSPVAVRMLRDNLNTLKCNNAEVIQTDASLWLNQPAAEGYNLVFLDPPFNKGMLAPACKLLAENGYLTDDAVIYVETEAMLGQPDVPGNWRLWKEKGAGQLVSRLYQTS